MKTKILYFINGSLPTEEDFKIAKTIDAKVCFRNVNMIGDDEKLEDCNFVLGCVPKIYNEIPEWELEIKVPSNPIKTPIKVPKIEEKKESKQSAPWTPNN